MKVSDWIEKWKTDFGSEKHTGDPLLIIRERNEYELYCGHALDAPPCFYDMEILIGNRVIATMIPERKDATVLSIDFTTFKKGDHVLITGGTSADWEQFLSGDSPSYMKEGTDDMKREAYLSADILRVHHVYGDSLCLARYDLIDYQNRILTGFYPWELSRSGF